MKLLDDRAVRWLLVPAVVFLSQTISDAYLLDFWHHLARGREIVTSGHLLDQDIFTYTVAGRPFQDVNWGSLGSFTTRSTVSADSDWFAS